MSLDIYLKYEVEKDKWVTVFRANITHNLAKMAEAANIYYELWRPDAIEITQAKELIEPLTKAIEDMKKHKEQYEKNNSPNGWGLYDNFVPWLERYIEACKEYPNAIIEVSR